MQADVRKRVQQVLTAVMKDENAVAFFNDPVDAEGLGIAQEYREVVKVPMDLSRVLEKLHSGFYPHPSAVLRETALIWRNCRAFNMPGSDVFNACNQLEALFDKQWRKARLERLTDGLVSHSFASEGQAHPLDTKPAQDSRVMLGSIKGGAAKQPAVSRALAGTKNLQPSSRSAAPVDANALRTGHPFQRCLNVVVYLSQHPDAEPFSAPVDTSLYPDYLQHVHQPMDLATIRDRLAPGATQGWGTILYKSTGEVLADVRQVWRNCRSFNGANDPITKACNSLEMLFDEAWTAAGLSLDANLPSGYPKRAAPPSLNTAYSPRAPQPPSAPPPMPTSPSIKRKASESAAPLSGRGSQSVHPAASEHLQARRQAAARRQADSDPDYEEGRESEDEGGSDSRHSLSDDSAGSWQPRRKTAKRKPGVSSPSSVATGSATSRCAACIKAKRGRCGTFQAATGCLRRKQMADSPAGDDQHILPDLLQPQTHALALGPPRGSGSMAADSPAAAAQRQAYALAKQRAEVAAAADRETDAERAVLQDHARLQQARQRAADALQAAEKAIQELHTARHVLRVVEQAEAAKAQAHDRAAKLEKEPWPPGARLVSASQAHELAQQASQQGPRALHPEVTALAQHWLGFDSPVLQSSVDSASTHQRANQPAIA